MSDLFESSGLEGDAPRPLADRLRPATLAEVVGQDHLIGPAGPLGRMIAERRPHSMVVWGPPGTGKTTIARLLSTAFHLHFVQLSAVFTGVADLKKTFEAARARRKTGQGTLLFVDEIHRFNRSQQDSFLPVVEDGTIILIGATTENPSFGRRCWCSGGWTMLLWKCCSSAQKSSTSENFRLRRMHASPYARWPMATADTCSI